MIVRGSEGTPQSYVMSRNLCPQVHSSPSFLSSPLLAWGGSFSRPYSRFFPYVCPNQPLAFLRTHLPPRFVAYSPCSKPALDPALCDGDELVRRFFDNRRRVALHAPGFECFGPVQLLLVCLWHVRSTYDSRDFLCARPLFVAPHRCEPCLLFS